MSEINLYKPHHIYNACIEALKNDLNTPLALKYMFDLTKIIFKTKDPEIRKITQKYLKDCLTLLGLYPPSQRGK